MHILFRTISGFPEMPLIADMITVLWRWLWPLDSDSWLLPFLTFLLLVYYSYDTSWLLLLLLLLGLGSVCSSPSFPSLSLSLPPLGHLGPHLCHSAWASLVLQSRLWLTPRLTNSASSVDSSSHLASTKNKGSLRSDIIDQSSCWTGGNIRGRRRMVWYLWYHIIAW